MSNPRRLSRNGVSPLDDFAFQSRQADNPDPDAIGEEAEVQVLTPEGWDTRNIAALVTLCGAQPGEQLHAGHVLSELAESLAEGDAVALFLLDLVLDDLGRRLGLGVVFNGLGDAVDHQARVSAEFLEPAHGVIVGRSHG